MEYYSKLLKWFKKREVRIFFTVHKRLHFIRFDKIIDIQLIKRELAPGEEGQGWGTAIVFESGGVVMEKFIPHLGGVEGDDGVGNAEDTHNRLLQHLAEAL